MRTHRSLRTSVRVLSVVTLLVLGAALFGSERAFEEASQSVARYQAEQYRPALAAATLGAELNAVRATLLTMLETDAAELPGLHRSLDASTGTIEQLFEGALRAEAVEDAELAARMRELRSVWTAFRTERDRELLPLIDAGKTAEARALVVGVQRERYAKMRVLLDDVVKEDEAHGAALSEEIASRQQALLVFFVVVAAASLGLMATLVWLVTRALARMDRLRLAMRRIVEAKDFRGAIAIEGHDEIAQVAMDFAELVAAVRSLVAGLQGASRVLAQTGRSLAELSARRDEASTLQAAAIQETHVTAQEIRQASRVAAEKAGTVLSLAAESDEVSRVGEDSVTRSITGLEGIRAQVQSLVGVVTELGERTRRIGAITGTVKELASQTNMLALNAAIEATRSGEHGKGFTVVAREMRSLADRSLAATRQIGQVLEEISQAVAHASEAAQSGAVKVDEGVAQVKSSGESLNSLAATMRSTAAAARQIAGAVSQQDAGISQIFTAVAEQQAFGEDSLKQVAHAGEVAKNLELAAGEVARLVEQYRVDEAA